MESRSPAAPAARLSAIKIFVLDRLDDPALCLADIAAHMRISTSYVRKLFAAEGTTFTTFVLGMRLANVARLLTAPETRAESVSAIALRCGFNDISYFNRAFRRRFGCTPSQWRRGQGTPPAAGPSVGTD